MDLMTTLATVSQATKIAKDLQTISADFNTAEYKAKMAELYSTLADVKMALADVRQELAEKDKEISRLRENADFGESLVRYRGFSYEAFDDGSPKGKPFCPRCEEKTRAFYRVTQDRTVAGHPWRCPECKALYQYTDAKSFPWEASTPETPR